MFLFCLASSTSSLSEMSSERWSVECGEDKSRCVIGIISETTAENSKKQTLATAIIQIANYKEKIMDLIDKDKQTYKLGEKKTDVTVLYMYLPFNTDLRKKPAIIIDGKNLGNLTFTNCNQADGCRTNVVIANDAIELFKKGKTMSVVMAIYGSNPPRNLKIEFPLKNFSKSYAKLIKK